MRCTLIRPEAKVVTLGEVGNGELFVFPSDKKEQIRMAGEPGVHVEHAHLPDGFVLNIDLSTGVVHASPPNTEVVLVEGRLEGKLV